MDGWTEGLKGHQHNRADGQTETWVNDGWVRGLAYRWTAERWTVDGWEGAHGWMGGWKEGGGLMEGRMDARPANRWADRRRGGCVGGYV